MITKKILAEKILRRVFGGDIPSTKPFDERDVYLEAESCRNYLIEKYLNLYGEDIQGEFITTYEAVPVLKNEARNRYYSVMPAQLVSARSTRNISGIRQVSGVQEEYDVFIPLKSGDLSVFNGLEASGLGCQIGYWIESDKLYYENMPALFDGKTVMVKMISSIYSLDEDEYIPIPASVEVELEDMIFERLLMMYQTKEDRIPDNT